MQTLHVSFHIYSFLYLGRSTFLTQVWQATVHRKVVEKTCLIFLKAGCQSLEPMRQTYKRFSLNVPPHIMILLYFYLPGLLACEISLEMRFNITNTNTAPPRGLPYHHVISYSAFHFMTVV